MKIDKILKKLEIAYGNYEIIEKSENEIKLKINTFLSTHDIEILQNIDKHNDNKDENIIIRIFIEKCKLVISLSVLSVYDTE